MRYSGNNLLAQAWLQDFPQWGYSGSFFLHSRLATHSLSSTLHFRGACLVRWFYILCIGLLGWQPGVYFQNEVLHLLESFLNSSEDCMSHGLSSFLGLFVHLIEFFFSRLPTLVDLILILRVIRGCYSVFYQVLRHWLPAPIMVTNKSSLLSLFLLRIRHL